MKQKLTLSPVLSMLDFAKHNPQSSSYKTKPEKNQYLASPPSRDQFAINVKSNNEANNVVATIKGLFLNIRHRSFYERLMENAVYEIFKFFMYFVKHMSSKDQMALHKIRSGLRPF